MQMNAPHLSSSSRVHTLVSTKMESQKRPCAECNQRFEFVPGYRKRVSRLCQSCTTKQETGAFYLGTNRCIEILFQGNVFYSGTIQEEDGSETRCVCEGCSESDGIFHTILFDDGDRMQFYLPSHFARFKTSDGQYYGSEDLFSIGSKISREG